MHALTLVPAVPTLRRSRPKENPMKKSLLLLALLAAAASAPAVDTVEPAPRATPTRSVDRLASARGAIDRKDWDGAMRDLNVAVRESPQNADVHNLLGYTYRKRANPDMAKAYEHYNMALKINPQHKGAHEYIGEAYLIDRKPQEAEQHLAALERICGGQSCEEYQDLAKSIAEYKAKN
jgi:Flp pilus assembly protein TadD